MAGLAACRGKRDTVSLWRKSLKVRCRRFCIVLRQLGALALMISLPTVGYSESSLTAGFGLRNQNPFLQVFGLPTLQSATLASAGKPDYGIALDLANHADAGANALETFVVDGETYFLTFSARRRVLPWLELGLDLPMLTHVDGFMDDGIESWHSTFGLSNTKRRGASDELNFRYDRGGVTQFELTSSTAGIGDVQLTAAIPLREADADDGLAVAVRSSVKLPTGDERELRGSGAADLSLALHVSCSTVNLRYREWPVHWPWAMARFCRICSAALCPLVASWRGGRLASDSRSRRSSIFRVATLTATSKNWAAIPRNWPSVAACARKTAARCFDSLSSRMYPRTQLPTSRCIFQSLASESADES